MSDLPPGAGCLCLHAYTYLCVTGYVETLIAGDLLGIVLGISCTNLSALILLRVLAQVCVWQYAHATTSTCVEATEPMWASISCFFFSLVK